MTLLFIAFFGDSYRSSRIFSVFIDAAILRILCCLFLFCLRKTLETRFHTSFVKIDVTAFENLVALPRPQGLSCQETATGKVLLLFLFWKQEQKTTSQARKSKGEERVPKYIFPVRLFLLRFGNLDRQGRPDQNRNPVF